MALYLIAIGGTGAKCAEAIVHIAAANLLTKDPVRIIFVDQDESNGNVTRAKTAVKIYSQCYEIFKDDPQRPWMQNPIEIFDETVWSPVKEAGKSLGRVFNYDLLQQSKPELKHLFDVLYTENERETPLVGGFRGYPAIGSAVMSRLNLSKEEPWKGLIEKIKQDTSDQTPRIFLFGSVFGGTGASGLHAISRILAKQLEKEVGKVKIGGLLMLPYFTFPTEQAPKDEIYSGPEQFFLNTAEALRYYNSQARNQGETNGGMNYLGFDAIYLLGMPKLSQVNEKFKLGKAAQENDPHFLELYAALAARHFLVNTPTQGLLIMRRQMPDQIGWSDIPERAEVRKKLQQATRFAFTWTASIFPELTAGEKNTKQLVRKAPWVEKFFNSNTIFSRFARNQLPQLSASDQLQALEYINQWSEAYLKWLGALHEDNNYSIRLFKHDAFIKDGQINRQRGDFTDLTYDAPKPKGGIQYLKNRLNPDPNESSYGTLGLAKAIYKLCDPD